jgi:thiamine-phosphate pyrophosphorylase
LRNSRIRGLYAITPGLNNTNVLLDKVRQVLEGGAQLIQYRNKVAGDALLREQAALLLQLCRRYGVPMIINDHVKLAIEIDADGIHIGQYDISIINAKEQLEPTKIVGISCYNSVKLARQAEKQGADYVAFGAFFPSLTKFDTVSVPKSLMDQAKNEISIPIVGIGGIQLTNAKIIIESGCTSIAVCHDLFFAKDITATAQQYTQLFTEAL